MGLSGVEWGVCLFNRFSMENTLEWWDSGWWLGGGGVGVLLANSMANPSAMSKKSKCESPPFFLISTELLLSRFCQDCTAHSTHVARFHNGQTTARKPLFNVADTAAKKVFLFLSSRYLSSHQHHFSCGFYYCCKKPSHRPRAYS